MSLRPPRRWTGRRAALGALAIAAAAAAHGCKLTQTPAPHAGDAGATAPRSPRPAPPPPAPPPPAPELAPAARPPRSLGVDAVRARARSASERVLEAEALVRKAKAHEDATFNEIFFPKLDAHASYVRTDRQLAIETPFVEIEIAGRDLGLEMVKATQPLLDVAGFFFRMGAEREATEVARLAAERAADLAELEAVHAFYAALALREQGVALERSVAALKSRLADVQNLEKARRARENDVTKVRLELARREQALLATRHREREARLDLLAALAFPVDAAVDLAEPPAAAAAPAAPPVRDLVARALTRRADLQALTAADRRLAAVEDAFLADYAPRISGFVDYRYDVNKVYNDADAVEAGVELDWRIFDGFARDEKRAEASAEREAVRARRRDLERRVAVEVERAALWIDEQRSALAVAQTSVKQAESSLRIEVDLLHADRSTTSNVLDAELRLFESRVELARARYGVLEAAAALRTAIGGE
jgi:outer membrane protein TolC